MKSDLEDLDVLSEEIELFEHYKEGNTSRAFQTFVKAKYQAFVRTNAISDHKAHILVSINSIFIGGVFILMQLNPELSKLDMFIIMLFLVSMILSLVFATLAVKPLFSKVKNKNTMSSRNAMAFHRVGHYRKSDYFKAFDETMTDQKMIYENIASDFFMFGVLLKDKYIMLNRAYNIFIGGLIVTSVLWLFDLFLFNFLI